MTVPIKINIYFFRFEELSQSVTILGADKKGLSIPHTIRQEIRTNFKCQEPAQSYKLCILGMVVK